MKFGAFLWRRRTTVFGYIQTTIGVLAVSDGIFSPHVLKYILLANGLLTAWLGHFNQSRLKKQGPNP